MFATLFAAAVVVAVPEPAPPPRPAVPAAADLANEVDALSRRLFATEVTIIRGELTKATRSRPADEAFAVIDRLRRRSQEVDKELNALPVAVRAETNSPVPLLMPAGFPDAPVRQRVEPQELTDVRRELIAAEIGLLRREVGRLSGASGTTDVFDTITTLRGRLDRLDNELFQLTHPTLMLPPAR